MIFAIKAFFLPSLRWISIQQMWVVRLTPIRWQVFFLQNYRLEELINTLLTNWNISQAFLIHFTLYLYLWWSLYLWWRVPKLIYIFQKVSTCHFTLSFIWSKKIKWNIFSFVLKSKSTFCKHYFLPQWKYWQYKELFPYISFLRLLCFSFNNVVFKRFPCVSDLWKPAFEKSSKENSLKISKNIQLISAYRIEVFAYKITMNKGSTTRGL